MTTYEYDGDRLVRSVTVREPEWTPDVVDMHLAARRIESSIGPHGIPMAEAMDPANQFTFRGFSAPHVDWAEKARQDAKDAFYKANPDANRNGHMWGVKRRGE